jgi:hypothetical protein
VGGEHERCDMVAVAARSTAAGAVEGWTPLLVSPDRDRLNERFARLALHLAGDLCAAVGKDDAEGSTLLTKACTGLEGRGPEGSFDAGRGAISNIDHF